MTKHLIDSEFSGQTGALVINGIEYPGTFDLPPGYNGIDEDLPITFDVVYCSLALKIEEEIASGAYTMANVMANVIDIWTNATIHGVPFTIDDLAKEFKVEITFKDFGWWDLFKLMECNVDYSVTMALLAKVYSLDFQSFFFVNFGSTMEQLGNEGKLWIMSRTAGWQTGGLVSVFHCLNWLWWFVINIPLYSFRPSSMILITVHQILLVLL